MEREVEALVLSRVRGVGGRLFRALVDALGPAGRVLGAPRARLAAVDGVGPSVLEALSGRLDWDWARQEAHRAAAAGFSLLPYGTPGYPPLLAQIPDPPPVLYAAGAPEALTGPAVAVIGSRKASTHGMRFAQGLARELAGRGVVVVSGLAQGIDAAAHRGALEAGGRTVAVFGSGLDVLYPTANAELARALRPSGAWVGELPLGSEPLAHHFPRRNRIISGLCLGVVVVEAAEKSGSLITAEAALDQGRDVFAVPGLPGSYNSRGAHRLLRLGAKLVESAEDVLEELPLGTQPPAARAPRPEEPVPDELRGLHGALEESPLHIDDLAARAGLPAARAAAGLMELCLRGHAEEWPGKLFVRQSR